MNSSPPAQQSSTPDEARESFAAGNKPRKRTRRACDKCSSFRVRCDGGHPCRRCQEYGHNCNYARNVKKRGRKPLSHRLGVGLFPQQHQTSLDPATPDFYQSTEQLHQYSPASGSDGRSRHDSTANNVTFAASDQSELHDEGRQTQRAFESFRQDYHCAVGDADHEGDEHAITLGHREPHGHSVRRISQLINPTLPAPILTNGSEHARAGSQPMGAPPAHPRSMNKRYHGCRYRCLEPVMPLLDGILEPKIACDLLEFFFAEPDGALFRHASPYVLSPVIRKRSLLRDENPRPTTTALLITMIWTSAQTADIPLLLLPGWRGQVCEKLRVLAMALVHERDRDHWHRAIGGRLLKEELFHSDALPDQFRGRLRTDDGAPCQTVDDLLTLILLTIVVSGGDFKPDSFVWYNKALTLSRSMGLNRTDGTCTEADNACMNTTCTCRKQSLTATSALADIEAQEERRRVFWLLFSLDRHLALSFNGNLFIHDDEVHVYIPLTDDVWEHLETAPFDLLTRRTFGPPTVVTGVGFFEYFTPLMTLLGDVIETHRRSLHPRLGALNDTAAVSMIENLLENCAQSINDLSALHDVDKYSNGTIPANYMGNPVMTPSTANSDQDPFSTTNTQFSHRHKPRRGQVLLVTSYARFIVNVLHVLLHGKWDAVSMLSPDLPPPLPSQPHAAQSLGISNWITSVEFMKCASHAIMASEAVETILSADPELTFMPYLLGIYLLHGSFILLLFADRMPQVGPNESVERACETIIRAHEVCVVTLSTEFQKSFRKVLRATLYEVRKNMNGEAGEIDTASTAGEKRRDNLSETEEGRARRSALSLYRWTRGSRGLAL